MKTLLFIMTLVWANLAFAAYDYNYNYDRDCSSDQITLLEEQVDFFEDLLKDNVIANAAKADVFDELDELDKQLVFCEDSFDPNNPPSYGNNDYLCHVHLVVLLELQVDFLEYLEDEVKSTGAEIEIYEHIDELNHELGYQLIESCEDFDSRGWSYSKALEALHLS